MRNDMYISSILYLCLSDNKNHNLRQIVANLKFQKKKPKKKKRKQSITASSITNSRLIIFSLYQPHNTHLNLPKKQSLNKIITIITPNQ